MFIDYYLVLGLDINASAEEIKSAYRRQIFVWHPDKNGSPLATIKMQELNEAYLILKDIDARRRYDFEHSRFQKQRSMYKIRTDVKIQNFDFEDKVLERWVLNARQQAKELVNQTLLELSIGAKAAASKMLEYVVAFIVIVVIMAIISGASH
jgi:curved DNA-binding protein CbpA